MAPILLGPCCAPNVDLMSTELQKFDIKSTFDAQGRYCAR